MFPARRAPALGFSLWLATLAAACSSNGAAMTPDAAVNQAFAEEHAFVAAVKQRECARTFDCCSWAENQYVGPSVDDCSKRWQDAYTATPGAPVLDPATIWLQSQATGRSRYDTAAAAACLDALDQLGCPSYQPNGVIAAAGNGDLFFVSGFSPLPAACRQVLVPLVRAGGRCEQGFECMTGACGADRKCAQPAALDEPCGQVPCADGLGCDFLVPNPTCQPLEPDGATCRFDTDCASGWCSASLPASGQCLARLSCDGSHPVACQYSQPLQIVSGTADATPCGPDDGTCVSGTITFGENGYTVAAGDVGEAFLFAGPAAPLLAYSLSSPAVSMPFKIGHIPAAATDACTLFHIGGLLDRNEGNFPPDPTKVEKVPPEDMVALDLVAGQGVDGIELQTP